MCRRSRCSWSSISTDRSFMSEELLYELREGIGVVTFNRPEVRNALTFAMYEGLAEICERAPDKGDARALVLRGAGNKAFAAGTDIAQFRSFKTAEDALGYEQRIDKVLGARSAERRVGKSCVSPCRSRWWAAL